MGSPMTDMDTETLANARPATRRPRAARVYVGIATRGRPQQVQHVLFRLRRQTLKPTAVVVVCVEPADVAEIKPGPGLAVLFGAPGLTKQRNVVLGHVPADADYVVFFDDDFLPDDRWLETVAAEFDADPSLACVTGNVVADGILGPGLSVEQGEAAIANADRRRLDWRIDGYSPYGCNMAFRASAIAGLRFDERLALYGWLEDRDFGSRAVAAGGRAIKLGAAVGVHLGVKSGRVSGKRLGYSQIVNPSYMCAKGTMTRRDAMKSVLRNVSANLAKSPRPESYIDRRGACMATCWAWLICSREFVIPNVRSCCELPGPDRTAACGGFVGGAIASDRLSPI